MSDRNELGDGIGKLLDESKDMIQRFEGLIDKAKVEEVSPRKLTSAGADQALEALEEELEPAGDAYFELFVDEEAMHAFGEFRPPSGEGKLLTFDVIEQALFNAEIVHGVKLDVIQQSIDACNLDKQHLTDVVIAEGSEPVPFVPEHIEFNPDLFKEDERELSDVKDVDLKEIKSFIMVETGQALATTIPDAFGVPGHDVLGREVAYPTKKQLEWSPGANVQETPLGFVATSDGRLVMESGTFFVNPVLELLDGVNYKTGNIKFKGEVIIKGKVGAGFLVEATGGITGTDTLDVFDFKVGKDIITPGGLIGNGDGRIEVGGTTKVKFLEHVRLTCQQDVLAESVVMNSIVKTRGKLLMGEKGILAGGQIHALHGVSVNQIGTATGPATQLFIGLDFAGMERINWIRDRSKELHAQLKKVDAAIPYGGARVKELMAAAKKLRLEIVQLTETARLQLMKLGQDEEATVEVRGNVFPSTHIEICHVQFLVNQKMSGVKFFLDKRKGTIGVEPFKGPPPSGLFRKTR